MSSGRRRLFKRLSEAPAGGVVLVCAPAGSGTTQLLRSWTEAEELAERTAWVAVERTGSNPALLRPITQNA